MKFLRAVCVFALVAAHLAVAPLAHAGPPGGNGIMIFSSDQDGSADLFSATPTGENPVNLTQTPNANEYLPSFSFDGNRVVYSSDGPGNFDLFVLDLQTQQPLQLTDHPAFDSEAQFCGNFIVFASDRDGDFELFRIRPDGTGLLQLTDNNVFDAQPTCTPNGNRVAFTAERQGGLGIYSITLGGKKERTVFDDPLVLETDPEYGGPGRLFLSFADLIEDIRLATVNLDTGESETLVSIPGADARLPKLAPNGEFVLFTSQVFDAQGDVQSESVGKVFLDPSGGPAGPPIFITDGIGSDAQAVVQPVVTFEVVQDPVTGRTLRITGTDGPDRVRVMVDPQDETQYLIEINGAFAGHVPVAEVDFVDIEMKAGDDVVALLGGSLFPVGVPARIQGGPGNDGLFGGSAADSIDGGEGDDELEGEGGDDTLNGGKGNDKLRGGRGNDHHSGGEGDDDMRDQTRSGETDTFDGGDGDDKVVAGGPGEVTVNGGPGDDEVTVSEVGDPDPDLLYWLDVYGGRGSDLLRGSRGREFFSGGPGGDDIRSGGGGDGIEGGGGPDEIDAGGGDDAVNPGPGNDDVDGGGGEDVLSEIDEVLVPSRGASLAASSGGDTLRGGPGDDVLRGGAGPDELYGDGGTDELEGGAGDDYLEGGTGGGDSCAGGSGRDRILIGTSRACEFYS